MERDGEIIIPAGTKAFGELQQANRSGIVSVRFHTLQMPDGTAEKIEAWIRAHPSFRGNVPQNAPAAALQGAAPVSIVDELTKLAQLRDAGVLSPEEFDRAKAKLLA